MMIHQKLNGLASVLWKTALITLKLATSSTIWFLSRLKQIPNETNPHLKCEITHDEFWSAKKLNKPSSAVPPKRGLLPSHGRDRATSPSPSTETNMANTHASIPYRIQRESGKTMVNSKLTLQISRKKKHRVLFPTPKSKWTYCIYILRLLPPLNGVHLSPVVPALRRFSPKLQVPLQHLMGEFFLVRILKRTRQNSSKKHNMW